MNNNASLIQIIKQIARDERVASHPCDIMTGRVLSADPLEISISQKITLTKDFLLITQTASDAELAEGDTVAMIRASGGQKFL